MVVRKQIPRDSASCETLVTSKVRRPGRVPGNPFEHCYAETVVRRGWLLLRPPETPQSIKEMACNVRCWEIHVTLTREITWVIT